MQRRANPAEILQEIEHAAGGSLPVSLRAYDGSHVGPAAAPATILFNSPSAFRHLLTAPNELGFARAFINGDIDVEGDIFTALELKNMLHLKVDRQLLETAIRNFRPLFEGTRAEIPEEEMQMTGKLHSRSRDKRAVSSHYDVSNKFYELVLGPSMVYSCAIRFHEDDTLEQAQENKIDLICRKLALRPGMYLLDIGCGWGQLLIHAATRYGVRGLGLTLSAEQAEGARRRVKDAGVEDSVEIREQDYRELGKSALFDAICSVGMFEHVGRAQTKNYFETCYAHLKPTGRFVNHAISRAAQRQAKPWESFASHLHIDPYLAPFGLHSAQVPARGGFIDRYVFPDGELHEIGQTISWMQDAGFEARHMESFREHYAWTLRQWVANLQRNWNAAVNEVGEHRARIWLLYMAGGAVSFESDSLEVHQTLGVRTFGAKSNMPLRPEWENTTQSA
jgi:cyclopropane-fatty-acyl-phospholipid synthase